MISPDIFSSAIFTEVKIIPNCVNLPRRFGISTKPRKQQNEPPPTSPNIAKAILGEAQEGAIDQHW
jgi:hypothetical protein